MDLRRDQVLYVVTEQQVTVDERLCQRCDVGHRRALYEDV